MDNKGIVSDLSNGIIASVCVPLLEAEQFPLADTGHLGFGKLACFLP